MPYEGSSLRALWTEANTVDLARTLTVQKTAIETIVFFDAALDGKFTRGTYAGRVGHLRSQLRV